MKNILNIILVSDIDRLIYDEKPHYIVNRNNDEYTIKQSPIIFKNNIQEIFYNLAYDYDKIKKKNQLLFKNQVKKFILTENKKYKLDTKIYQLKKRKNHFPKQN